MLFRSLVLGGLCVMEKAAMRLEGRKARQNWLYEAFSALPQASEGAWWLRACVLEKAAMRQEDEDT